MMLSSSGQTQDAARCRELGLTAYLMKPVKQSDLLDAIMTSFGASVPERSTRPIPSRRSTTASSYVRPGS